MLEDTGKPLSFEACLVATFSLLIHENDSVAKSPLASMTYSDVQSPMTELA